MLSRVVGWLDWLGAKAVGLFEWFVDLGTSDKIATIAVVVAAITAAVGFLQFVVLYCTVRVMRRTAPQQMRAYVSVRPNFITSFDETHWARTEFALRNLGQTPAYHVRHRTEIEVLPDPLPPGFSLPRVTGEWAPPLVLFPNVDINGSKNRRAPFSAKELEGIRNRTLKLYILGKFATGTRFANGGG
jgi:hypothetical protein